MKRTLFSIVSLMLFFVLTNIEKASAQQLSGRIIFSNPSVPEIKTVNGATYRKEVYEVRVETDDKNSPFNNTSGVWEGWTTAGKQGDAFIVGVAVLADKDGDTYCTGGITMRKADHVPIYVKGGTGKFANIDGTGTASILRKADTGKAGDIRMQTWKVTFKSDQ